MIDPERASILQRARLRQDRIAILRRRRAIDEVRRQLDFEAMWTDPLRRAAYERQRRQFYQRCPHLYDPVSRTIGRRTMLARLGTLLTSPALAETPDFLRQIDPHGAGSL